MSLKIFDERATLAFPSPFKWQAIDHALMRPSELPHMDVIEASTNVLKNDPTQRQLGEGHTRLMYLAEQLTYLKEQLTPAYAADTLIYYVRACCRPAKLFSVLLEVVAKDPSQLSDKLFCTFMVSVGKADLRDNLFYKSILDHFKNTKDRPLECFVCALWSSVIAFDPIAQDLWDFVKSQDFSTVKERDRRMTLQAREGLKSVYGPYLGDLDFPLKIDTFDLRSNAELKFHQTLDLLCRSNPSLSYTPLPKDFSGYQPDFLVRNQSSEVVVEIAGSKGHFLMDEDMNLHISGNDKLMKRTIRKNHGLKVQYILDQELKGTPTDCLRVAADKLSPHLGEIRCCVVRESKPGHIIRRRRR